MLSKSPISKASHSLSLGTNTVFTSSFFDANKTAVLSHLKRIADFIELGPGNWYVVHEGALEFLDGFHEQDFQAVGPRLTHFR